MRRHRTPKTAPIKERPGGRGDFGIDAFLSAVVVLFVNCSAIQAENPGLYVALGYEVHDFLSFSARLKVCLEERVAELAHASIKVPAIRIDEDDKGCAGLCGPGTIGLNFQSIVLSHPLLTGTPTTWQLHKSRRYGVAV